MVKGIKRAILFFAVSTLPMQAISGVFDDFKELGDVIKDASKTVKDNLPAGKQNKQEQQPKQPPANSDKPEQANDDAFSLPTTKVTKPAKSTGANKTTANLVEKEIVDESGMIKPLALQYFDGQPVFNSMSRIQTHDLGALYTYKYGANVNDLKPFINFEYEKKLKDGKSIHPRWVPKTVLINLREDVASRYFDKMMSSYLWKGADNEFELQRVIDRYRKEVIPAMKKFSQKMPETVYFLETLGIGPYQHDGGYFPLASRRSLSFGLGTNKSRFAKIDSLIAPSGTKYPSKLVMAAADAEAMVSRSKAGSSNLVYVLFKFKLTKPVVGKNKRSAQLAAQPIEMIVFEDETLQREITKIKL